MALYDSKGEYRPDEWILGNNALKTKKRSFSVKKEKHFSDIITSIRLSSTQKNWIDKLSKEKQFFSGSEVIRYCIQFQIDLQKLTSTTEIDGGDKK